jgi:hypothetical protein
MKKNFIEKIELRDVVKGKSCKKLQRAKKVKGVKIIIRISGMAIKRLFLELGENFAVNF